METGISRRLTDLPESATMAITARAAALRAAGEPVIGFGAGEPDFPTPPHVVEAAQRAAADPRNHRYGPAAGLPELREAVAAVASRTSRGAVTAEQVVITPGAKGAVFGAMAALLEPGDEVILPSPYWVTYPAAAALFGARARVVPTTAASGYKATLDELEAVRTDRTKLLVHCSPGNPSGMVHDPDEVAAVGEWALKHKVWVLSDDIYRELVYGEAQHTPLTVAVPELAERCVVVDGVSKTFAMTGWRVGWLTGPPEVAAAVARLQSHSTSNVSAVCQRAALAALTGPRDATIAMWEAFDRRRRTMHAMLTEIDGVDCPEPEGAFYAFPDVAELLGRPLGGSAPETSLDMAAALLEHAQIAVVPGEAFGSPGHIRLSFALADDLLVEGLERWQRLAAAG